jgi:hypothetical protein
MDSKCLSKICFQSKVSTSCCWDTVCPRVPLSGSRWEVQVWFRYLNSLRITVAFHSQVIDIGWQNRPCFFFFPSQLAPTLFHGLLGVLGRPTAPRWPCLLSMSSSSTLLGEPVACLMSADCWSETSSPTSWTASINVTLDISKWIQG